MYFEVYRDAAGEYRWRLKAGNNRIVADSGQGYVARESAEREIAKFKLEVVQATVYRI